MDAHYLKVSLILIISSAVLSRVASDRFYILSSPDQPCPGDTTGDQCLSLQQYVTGNYTASNVSMPMQVSLEILSGIHKIQANDSISMSNISSFEVNGSNATILCDEFNNSLIFEFKRIDRVNIRGLTLTGCRGAWFISTRVLTIQDTNFQHHGAVILNAVLNATITNSSLVNGRKLLVHSSTLLIKETVFSNLTVSDNYSQCYQDPHGGAIRTNNSNITIEQCTFVNNKASCMSNSSMDGWGGAVYANNTKLNITDSNFTGNSAAQAGGAISVDNSLILVRYSQFNYNLAMGNAGVLYIENSSLLVILYSFFYNNKAEYNGGVLYSTAESPVIIFMTQSIFSHNQAAVDGGVMYVRGSDSNVTVRNSNFSFNSATERGGVIAITGSQLNIDQITTLYNNTAIYGGVISACSSRVVAPGDLMQTVDPNNSNCSLYDEYQHMPMTTTTINTTETIEVSSTSLPSKATTIPGTSTSEATTTIALSKATTTPGTNTTPMSPGLTTTAMIPSPSKTGDQNVIPTIPLGLENYTTALYTTLGIAIVVCILLFLLYIIVLCIVLYLCGVLKSKRRLVDNPYVYVPMKENESTADNETAS